MHSFADTSHRTTQPYSSAPDPNFTLRADASYASASSVSSYPSPLTATVDVSVVARNRYYLNQKTPAAAAAPPPRYDNRTDQFDYSHPSSGFVGIGELQREFHDENVEIDTRTLQKPAF